MTQNDKMKYFIITVDTEGDNLWKWYKGDPIKTRNTKFIPRFQSLCDEFGFKPVYLTNYEMLCDDEYVKMVCEWQKQEVCEVGLHIHAWNNPPIHELNAVYNGNPYMIEYPEEIIRAKFKVLYDLFVEKTGTKPLSHRSGRWAMNDLYFQLLNENGVQIDCSHTPHISWVNSKGATIGGSDYTNVLERPSIINGVYEVPLTVRKVHHALNGGFKHRIRTLLHGENLQLRPATFSFSQMKKLIDIIEGEPQTDYLEFMLHSSELMPGGSPYFKNEESIEREYDKIKKIFCYVKQNGYEGVTLMDYANRTLLK